MEGKEEVSESDWKTWHPALVYYVAVQVNGLRSREKMTERNKKRGKSCDYVECKRSCFQSPNPVPRTLREVTGDSLSTVLP